MKGVNFLAQGNGNQQFGDVLDHIYATSPEVQKQMKTWSNKSPEELASAGRKTLYGVLQPALLESDAAADQIAQVEAIFEAIFKTVETGTRSGSRSRTPSMSGP